MAKPYLYCGQLEHGEIVRGSFFVARGDPSEVFDTIEESLYPVALPIERRAEAGLPAAMDHCWNVRRRAGGFDLSPQPVGVISLVGQDDAVLPQTAKQLSGDRTIASLTRRQDHLQRQTPGIGECMDLCGQSAARAAHTAIRVTFFEVAPC